MKTLNTSNQEHRRLKQRLWVIEIIIFLISLLFTQISNAQNVTIPDANFKSYLVGNNSINTNLDSEIQTTEATAFSGSVIASNLNINDLAGIEAFTNITSLYAEGNNLTSIDLSQNVNLAFVYLGFNDITEINLSTGTALEELYVNNNNLTALDVSQNASLRKLSFANNSLTSIDLSGNPALEWIRGFGNTLTALDISANTQLKYLSINGVNLTSLDLSQNPQLEFLYANSNPLTSLDISSNTNLKELHLWNNQLTSLDLSNNPLLVDLNLGSNTGITSLDLSQNTLLTQLDASETGITTIDLSNNVALENLAITDNGLSSIDVTPLTALTDLYLYGTQIESIDLTHNTNLMYLDLEYSQLTNIDISQNTLLEEAILNGNPLTHLNAANGNNEILYLEVDTSPNLSCIQVSNLDYATANWVKDETATFSLDCPDPFDLISLNPSNGASNAPMNAILTLTFSHDADIGAGNISVYKSSTDELVAQLSNFNGTYMTIDGPSITFDLPDDFPQGEELYVLVSESYLRSDLYSENWNGFQNKTDWTFTVEDNRPQIQSFTPTIAEVGAGNVVLEITYDRNIALTTSNTPSLKVYDSENNQVASFNQASPNIEINGATASLTLSYPLASASSYYIILSEGLFVDAQDTNNGAVGITDPSQWVFSTRVNDGNGPDIVNLSPSNGATQVERAGNAIDFEITFDEPVYLGNPNGAVRLYREEGEIDALYYNIGSIASISADNLTVTFNIPLNYTMQPNTEYYILLDATNGSNQVIFDADGNSVIPITNENDWRFTTYGPVEILATSPADDATDTSTDGVVTFTTNNEITVATGASVYLKYYSNNANAAVVASDSEDVQLNGNEVTINFGTLSSNTQYYVYIPNNTFRDEFNQTFTIAGADTWNFTTGDEVAPTLTTRFPAHQSFDVSATTDLILTFDEDVQLTGSGIFKMFNRANDELIGTIWSFDSGATVDGNTVTYDIPIDLPYGTEIYFEITNAIEDLAGNDFPGIIGNSSWFFTVEGETISPEIVSLSPSNRAIEVPINTNLVMTFDEPVQLTGNGSFRMYNQATDEQIGVNWFFDSGATVDGNTVTYDIPMDLPYETTVYFTIVNAIEDEWGNKGPNILGNTGWVVTTESAPDTTPPTISTLSPADDATGVAINEPLRITFNEDIMIASSGATKQAVIKHGSNQNFEVIPLTNENIDGSVLTIPHSDFQNDISYYVYLADGVISDMSNNWFSGIIESTEWNFTTAAKLDQTITFDAITDKVYGDHPFLINASASSGLDVTFSVVSGPVTLSNNELTITGAGTAVIAANQAGNETFNPAPEVQQSFVISKADQVITIEPIDDKLINDPSFDIIATVDSNLELTYSIDGPATISGTTITLNGNTGTVTVTVSQAGNQNYNPVSENISFEVTEQAKQNQTITFDAIADKIYGDDPFLINASASSGLDVTFSVVSGPVTLSGNELTITGAGTAVIAANQAGNENFNPAPEVQQSFSIAKADQVITIEPIADKLTSDEPFDVIASVNSNLELTYSIDGPATISGTTITLNGNTGTVTVTVSQAGNQNYNPASENISFEVTEQVLSANDKPTMSLYPNPAHDYINIELSHVATIRLINMDGRVLLKKQLINGSIDISSLKTGIYIIEIISANTVQREQIIKAN